MARHLLIVNPRAGGGRVTERVKALASEYASPQQQFEVALTERPGHAIEIAEENAAAYDTLVAVGGDGMASEVATGLWASGCSGTRLALLPAGTGNDTALTLGITDWDTGISTLLGDGCCPMDAIEVRYVARQETRMRLSLVGAGVGFLADVANRATERVKRNLGRWSYHYATLAGALSFQCPRMKLVADGEVIEGNFLLCGALNLEWSAGHSLRVAPGARYDDGLLRLLVVKEASALRFLTKLPTLVNGTHIGLPEVEYRPVREVQVECDPPVGVMIDGDCLGQTPAQFRVLPGVLKVKVPDQPPSSGTMK